MFTTHAKHSIYGNLAFITIGCFLLGGLLEGGPDGPRASLYGALIITNMTVNLVWLLWQRR